MHLKMLSYAGWGEYCIYNKTVRFHFTITGDILKVQFNMPKMQRDSSITHT